MKKLLLISLILFASAFTAQAIPVTVATQTVPDVQFSGSSGELRIWATCGKSTFFTSDGVARVCGAVGTTNVYKSVTLSISGGVLTIPAFTIDSTTDSDQPQTKYSAIIYDSRGARKIDFMLNFSIPHTLGSNMSWSQIRTYNSATTVPLNPNTYYNREQVNTLVAQAETVILGSSTVRNKLACFNPDYYGASGADSGDDTSFLQSAITAANSAGGGTVCLSQGTYRTTGNITLPKNVTITGATGGTFAASGATKILLTSNNASIFTIGEGIEGVNFKDIELKASSTTGTTAVKFTGAAPNSSQTFIFDTVTFTGFDKAIYVLATDGSLNWQASYAKILNSVFNTNTTGLWIEARNSEWHIENSVFYTPQDGDAIKCETCGNLSVRNTYNNGPVVSPVCTAEGSAPSYTPTYSTSLANSFVTINGAHSNVMIETSHNEGAKYFLVNNAEELTFPIIVMGNSINDIRLNADVYFISKGNRYYVNSVVATGADNDTRIFSEGDRVYEVAAQRQTKCNNNGTGTGFVLSGGSRIVTKTTFNGIQFPLISRFGDLNEPDDGDDFSNSVPKVSIGVNATQSAAGKPFLRLGETSSGAFTSQTFDFFRNQTNGFLELRAGQSAPYKGFIVDGALQLKQQASFLQGEANSVNLVVDSNNILKLCVNGQSAVCDPVTSVNPKWFGAKGDGTTDDTSAIAATITAAGSYPVKFEQGTYMVTQVELPNNAHIIVSNGATIKARSNIPDGNAVLLCRDKSNITIEGQGTLDGNRSNVGSNRVTTVIMQGCQNVTIKGITIKGGHSQTGSFGDGLYLLGGFNTTQIPQDILIDGVTFDANDRNGMQVSACNRCRFVNNTFKNTNPLDGWLGPSAGIDFENHPLATNVTDAVTNGTTTITSATANFTQFNVSNSPLITITIPTGSGGGFYQGTITAINSATSVEVDVAPSFSLTGLSMTINAQGYLKFHEVLIANNHFSNNLGGGVIVNGRNNQPIKGMTFVNNTFKDNGEFGLSFGGGFSDGVSVSNNSFSGTTGNCGGGFDGTGLVITGFTSGITVSGNEIFDNDCFGIMISGSAHYKIIGNKIIRNKQHGINTRFDTAFQSTMGLGNFGTIAYNTIFNNGTATANTYDGIRINGNAGAGNRNTGLNVAGNWFGNDPFIRATPTQRYSVFIVDADGQGGTYLLNNHAGNLTGNIVANTGAAINPIMEFSPFVADKPRSLVFGSVESGSGYNAGGTINYPTYIPAQITSNQNNYAINGRSYIIEISSDAARTITGIVAGANGERHLLVNVGSHPITLTHEDTNSTGANRFLSPYNGSFVIQPYSTAEIVYGTSNNLTRWLIKSPAPLTATATLDFDLTTNATHDLTVTVTGATTGDTCTLGVPNASITADTMFSCWVSSSNTVTVRAMRIAGTPDPASGTFRVKVEK